MRSNLRDELEELAPRPRANLDFGSVWHRARQLRRRRMLLFATAIVVATGGVAGAFALPFDGEPANVNPATPPESRPQDTPTTGAEGRGAESADSYPLLFSRGGLNVYAPGKGQPFGWCPRGALSVSADDIEAARRLMPVAAHVFVKKNLAPRQFRKAKVGGAGVGPRGVFIPQRKACGIETARRTVVLGVTFPKVAEWSASMGSATFYLSREDRGWVIWDQPN